MMDCERGESLAFSLSVVPKFAVIHLVDLLHNCFNLASWHCPTLFSLCSQPKDPFSLFSRASAVRRKTHSAPNRQLKPPAYRKEPRSERNELPRRSARPHVPFFSLIISGSLSRLPLPLVSDNRLPSSCDRRRKRPTHPNHRDSPSRSFLSFFFSSIFLLLSFFRFCALDQRLSTQHRHHAAAVRSHFYLILFLPLCAYIFFIHSSSPAPQYYTKVTKPRHTQRVPALM